MSPLHNPHIKFFCRDHFNALNVIKTTKEENIWRGIKHLCMQARMIADYWSAHIWSLMDAFKHSRTEINKESMSPGLMRKNWSAMFALLMYRIMKIIQKKQEIRQWLKCTFRKNHNFESIWVKCMVRVTNVVTVASTFLSVNNSICISQELEKVRRSVQSTFISNTNSSLINQRMEKMTFHLNHQ